MRTVKAVKGNYSIEYLKDNGMARLSGLTRRESYSLALSISAFYGGVEVIRVLPASEYHRDQVVKATPIKRG